MNGPRIIVVSGGSRGLGAAIVQRLLDAGHAVATFSRRPSRRIAQWQADEALAQRFCYEPIDITDAAALREFVNATYNRFGRIDVLVNNAGVATEGLLATADDESLQKMIDVNLAAAIRLTRECARQMLRQERGVILNIASVAALRGVAGLAVYSATKAGLVGLTQSLARELGGKGIRVNAIAPGYLETDMSHGLTERQHDRIIRRTPLGRLGKVEDIVPWVEFLLGDAAAFATGQIITIDGGASV